MSSEAEATTDDEGLLDDVELVDVDDVYPYAQNAKEHPDAQVDKIASSIREFGWDQPIVTDSEGEIIKGHGRYAAAKRLGFERVPVIRNEFDSEADKRAARIADNRVAESDWDDELLSTELERLDEGDYQLELTGFDQQELDAMIDDVEPDFELPDGEKDDGVDESQDMSGHIVATLQVDIDDWQELKPILIDYQEQYDFDLDVA